MEREILLHLDYDCFIPAEQYVPLPTLLFPPVNRDKRELTLWLSFPRL